MRGTRGAARTTAVSSQRHSAHLPLESSTAMEKWVFLNLQRGKVESPFFFPSGSERLFRDCDLKGLQWQGPLMYDAGCHPLDCAHRGRDTLHTRSSRDSSPETGKTGPTWESEDVSGPGALPAGAGAVGHTDSHWVLQRPLPQHLGQSQSSLRTPFPSFCVLLGRTVGMIPPSTSWRVPGVLASAGPWKSTQSAFSAQKSRASVLCTCCWWPPATRDPALGLSLGQCD